GGGIDSSLPNDVEGNTWPVQDDIEADIRGLGEVAKTAVVTLGAQGAAVNTGGEIIRIAPTPTKAIDSNGAGDMFAGAFLYAITHGYDHAAAGRLASAAASTTVSHFGPRLSPAQHQEILKKVFS